MNLPNPTNHVLVDFENVCDIDATILDNKGVILVLLVGAARKTLDLDLVEKLLPHAAAVQLIRLTSSGKNALDFALAYYLGCAATADPHGFFHIISKDKGFDPLVEHLQSRHLRVRRHDGFAMLDFCSRPQTTAADSAVPAAKPKAVPKPKPEPVTIEALTGQVLAHLRKTSTNRPKSRKTLVRYVVTHLGNGTTDAQAESVVENLSQAGHVVADSKGSLTYWLESK